MLAVMEAYRQQRFKTDANGSGVRWRARRLSARTWRTRANQLIDSRKPSRELAVALKVPGPYDAEAVQGP